MIPGLGDPPYLPTSDLVVVTWLRTFTPLGGHVATSLPKELPDGLFMTVRPLNAGIPAVDLPTRSPLITLDAWASAGGKSNKPRWGAAAQMCELVRQACDNDVQRFGVTLDLGADYLPARMQSVYLSTEPRKVENDPSAYARYSFDIIADWVLAELP